MNKFFFKIALFVVFSFLYTNESKAQGNLQFNKVKLVSAVDTVPRNKVWKVESITYPNPSNFIPSFNYISEIFVNGGSTIVKMSQLTLSYSWEMKYPFWLPSGTTLQASNNVNYISIIEYNIIP
jgi:hypothetical protein